MSGTEIALIAAGITVVGGVIAAVVGAVLTGKLDWRNSRRAAHEPAVAAARLIKREMETIYADATLALERGLEEAPLPHAEWDAHKAAAAARLTPEELMVLDTFYRVVRHGALPGIPALYSTASQAINWLARGDVNTVKPRKTETSLAPMNMDLPCRCGHIFGDHGWRAEKRRIRFRHRHARYKDVGYECKGCDCKKFKGVGRLIYR
jgi:hypothetical protein